MRYKNGYRMINLLLDGWFYFIPTRHTLLSPHHEKNVLGFEQKFDSHTLAGKHRVHTKLKDIDAVLCHFQQHKFIDVILNLKGTKFHFDMESFSK